MTITLTREEAQQMLDALESVYGKGKKCDAAIKTLRARLSAPEPEPWAGVDFDIKTVSPHREWQGLTDEDRQELAAEQYGWEGLCSAVEAKLREKNGNL